MKIRLLGATTMIAALAAAGCATSPGYGGGYNGGYNNAPPPAYGNANSCYDCGRVIRIETLGGAKSMPNATGAVLGGIVGAIAGHEISDKTGGSKGNQNISAAAGAAAGALAGNAIQNNSQARSSYTIYVRMDDGRTTTITQTDLAGIREGSYVRISGGRAMLR